MQTAFLGDVILATPLVEVLHEQGHEIHFMCRRGNQSLLIDHPKISKLWVFDKKKKYYEILRLIRALRKETYDTVYNLQRFFTSCMMAVLSGTSRVVGFDKNPWARFYTDKLPHVIDPSAETPLHEVDRNLSLLRQPELGRVRPRLYPRPEDYARVAEFSDFITISPASVWFTKQYPREKWIAFLDRLPQGQKVLILGGPADVELAEYIREHTQHPATQVLAGELSLLESTALMESAQMNYTNDSGPTHMASSVNAPVTTLYCSTIPEFGFWPLSEDATVLQTTEKLDCRPCGLHGYQTCPVGDFRCPQYEI